MSGLCPPVPTELVSVFHLKTGSVQQEQEWSPLTSRIYVPCCLTDFHRKTAQPRFNSSALCLVDHTQHRAFGPDENQTRALQPVRRWHWTLKVYARRCSFRWLSLSLLKYECFMSRFTIFCLIGRPWRPEPLCEYCYILILLLCAAFMFISAFFPWKSCKHVSLFAHVCLPLTLFFLSFCAVKGQAETGVHCQVIPMKCLLCLCNWCHPAVPIISDWECVQCCFFPTLQIILAATKGKVLHLEDFIPTGKWKLISKHDESALIQQFHSSWLAP